MSFFQASVVNKYIATFDKDIVNEAYNVFVSYFHDSDIQKNIRAAKEEQFQEGFLRELFVKVLGYTINPNTNYNLTTEFKNAKGSKKADGAILVGGKAISVIELKGTNTTNLDKVNDQAFGYKNNQENCIYIITSNFEKLRFFIHNAVDHIEFNLFTLDRAEFDLLWLCLSKASLLDGIPEKVKNESLIAEENITKELYKDYSDFKNDLWLDLIGGQRKTAHLTLYKKTQKLLDRFLFILFAEDSGLLPPNSISRIEERWKLLKDEDAYKPLYEIFKQYFNYINIGRKGKTTQDDIFAYNGGLFYPDEILDGIVLKDEMLLSHIKKLTAYNFKSEVDVNILGHIFENSLNDIDAIKSKIEGEIEKKKLSKRKKDGVFYTPGYITKYIVEETIGRLCIDKKVEIGIEDKDYARGKTRRKKTLVKQLHDNLNTYRDWLIDLKICDPACGSGAFLNQALSFLITEHAYIDELESKLLETPLLLRNISNHILEKNIFGVDINEESIDIAKLSLWLRTAQRGRKLTSLNNNIKCGNSLISQKNIASEKAFEWKSEFKNVFKEGGFDVIIGNPPYGDYFNKIEKDYLLKKYKKSFSGTFDMYIFFFDLAVDICRKDGIIGFITPYTFIDYSQFSGIRKTLLNGNNIREIIRLSDVFADAIVDTAIILLVKGQQQKSTYKAIRMKWKIYDIQSIRLKELNLSGLSKNGFILNDDSEFDINRLISNQKYQLGDLVKITQGITTGGNKCFIDTKENFIKKNIPEKILKKVIMGKTINRYYNTYDDKYILYSTKSVSESNQSKIANALLPFKGKLSKKRETVRGSLPWYCLHWARNKSDFNEPKILIRQTASHIIGTLDKDNYYPIDTLHTLNLLINTNDKGYILAGILGILNSNLIKYLYKWKLDEAGKVYPQVKKINIEWLPFPDIKKIASLSEKVVKIQSLVSSKRHDEVNFFEFVLSSFTSDKISIKISSFNDLEYIDFIKLLNTLSKKYNSKKLSKKEEMEWMEIFNDKKALDLESKGIIDKIDKEINIMVYKLYELTDAEIQLIEST